MFHIETSHREVKKKNLTFTFWAILALYVLTGVKMSESSKTGLHEAASLHQIL